MPYCGTSPGDREGGIVGEGDGAGGAAGGEGGAATRSGVSDLTFGLLQTGSPPMLSLERNAARAVRIAAPLGLDESPPDAVRDMAMICEPEGGVSQPSMSGFGEIASCRRVPESE